MSFGGNIDFDELYEAPSSDGLLQEKLNITHANDHETNYSSDEESSDDDDSAQQLPEGSLVQGVGPALSNLLKENHAAALPFSGCDDFEVMDQNDRKLLEDLKLENKRLKRQLRVVDPTIYFCDGNGPALEVIYLNSEFARLCKSKIEFFIADLLESYNQQRVPEDIPAVTLRNANVALSVKANKLLSDDASLHIQSSQVLSCSHLYEEFIMDSMGWPLTDDTAEQTLGYDPPMYSCAIDEVTDGALLTPEDEDKCPQPSKMNKGACFNCGESHSIADCKKPKNQNAINAARAKFAAQKVEMQAKNTRYHESKQVLELAANNKQGVVDMDPEVNHSKNSFKPGLISQKLRDALGLKDDQLPSYIYLMRDLGYPPGWYEMIKTASSGLSMLGKHGTEENIDGEEDGEIAEHGTSADTNYNEKNIVEYPGFNIEVPDGIIDEALEAGSQLPYMKNRHHKTSMIEEIQLLNVSSSSESKRHLSEDSQNKGQRNPKKQKTSHDSSMNDTQDTQELDNDEVFDISQLSSTGLSMSFDFGTPSHSETLSKIENLPSSEKWADGVIQHIPFENLPNSTGTYAKVNDILKKNKLKSKES